MRPKPEFGYRCSRFWNPAIDPQPRRQGKIGKLIRRRIHPERIMSGGVGPPVDIRSAAMLHFVVKYRKIRIWVKAEPCDA
jgi:hypothetical protein